MGNYLIAFFMVLITYVFYEIHKHRKRHGKRGIPVLGSIFDSFSVSVHEENLDGNEGECSEGSSRESKSKSKKKKHRKHKHSHHHRSSKKHKHHKSKPSKHVTPSDKREKVEYLTQRSEKNDKIKSKLNLKDSMDVGSRYVAKDEFVPAASIETPKPESKPSKN